MNPDRFAIAGYGPYRTVGDNSTEQGRALNRRVEIVVKPVAVQIMNTATVIANEAAPIRKYELGRPIIRREQRIAFERIHRAVAQAWSDSMTEYLPSDAALEFEGLDFDAFSSVSIDDSPCAQIALFSIASTPVSGFLMMTGALAKFLVRSRLGLKSATDDKADAPFTRIETAIARETTRAMLVRLGEAYATAGLGSIGNIRECDDLADSFLFAPEESLALLKFRMSAGSEELRASHRAQRQRRHCVV